MMRTRFSQRRRWLPAVALAAAGALISRSPLLEAQVRDTAMHGHAPAQDQQTTRQLQELRAEVARLKAELEQQRTAAPPSMGQPSGGGMGGMEGMDMMEMGGMNKAEMGGMAGGMGMMDMHEGEMGMPPEGMEMPPGMMDDMGRMASRPPMTPGGMPGAPAAGAGPSSAARPPKSMSSLPGVPGGSHLYHIGSTGFFLDQPQIGLTREQRAALNKIKERALLERGNAERRTEQAEQELWTLTGSDRPDAGKIEAKTREIERLRSDQRLAFIQAVGEATRLLTAEQRSKLLGAGTSPAK